MGFERKAKFVNLLENASAGTNVIIVSCGIDGVPADLKGRARVGWSNEDWLGPIGKTLGLLLSG